MTMHESRKAFLERMEAEGHSEEMGRRCKELLADGVKKADAGVIIEHEFGRRCVTRPETNGKSQTQPEDSERISEADRAFIEAKEPISDRAAMRWVFRSVGLAVGPRDAPNTGAWSYLQWIRSSPQAKSEFYSKVYPKLMANLDDEGDDYGDDGGPVTEMINRLLETMGRKAPEAEQPEDAADGG